MYKIITASADTYITNKILNASTKASDANMGKSSTIDIFKLYDESIFTGEATPIELSRGLIKFDLDNVPVTAPAELNFSCELKLFDVFGGQTSPSNFTLQLYPLRQAFDEGQGRDVSSFDDLGVCNYITASFSAGSDNTWEIPGAAGPAADIFTGYSTLTQVFEEGTEDLSIDVSAVISDMLDGTIPNNGFRLSFIATEETDTKTRFVKRFISRHSNDKNKTPRLIVKYDDTIQDSTTNLYDYTNYISTITNLKSEYSHSDNIRFHIFVEDRNYNNVVASKLPLERASLLLDNMYYSIVSNASGDIIIPFDTVGTKVSYDEDEMFFELNMSNLSKGMSYEIRFRIIESDGIQYTIQNKHIFMVM